jgi:hypothetical protein
MLFNDYVLLKYFTNHFGHTGHKYVGRGCHSKCFYFLVILKGPVFEMTTLNSTYLTNYSFIKSKHNRYTFFFLHVLALPRCHHQGILMLTQAAPPSWSSVCETATPDDGTPGLPKHLAGHCVSFVGTL